MVPASAAPTQEARAIFDDLGYSVDGDGQTFRARRAWKEVIVTVLDKPDPNRVTACGEEALCCFVAWKEHSREAASRLAEAVAGDWALIAVSEDGGYEVARRPD
ncbi:MAG: hypothetical protein ABEJ35_07945 [Halobacteriaceae archaeon]